MPELSLNSRLARLPDMVASEMDGDLVMMSIQQGQYFGISGVGTRIWQLIEHPVTVSEIVTVLVREFDVVEDTCRADVLKFASTLLEHKVVTLC